MAPLSAASRPELGPPATVRLLWRGATRRCPACGSGQLFRWWLRMVDQCPRCGLVFERIEGHWIGAIGINTIVSLGALLVATVAGLIASFPELPLLPLIAINVTVAVVTPIAFFPFSRTLWTAVDIMMRPLEPHEVDWTQAGGRRPNRHQSGPS